MESNSYIVLGGSGDLGLSIIKALMGFNRGIIRASYYKNKPNIFYPFINWFYFDANNGVIDNYTVASLLETNIKGVVFTIGIPSSKNSFLNTDLKEWEKLFKISALSFAKYGLPYIENIRKNHGES